MAVDINSRTPDFPQIIQSMKAAGFLWGGDWINPDRVHFYIGPIHPSDAAVQSVQDYFHACIQ